MGKGASTLDLVVAEFWSWCRQMDLASAYVQHPLNRLVLDFVTWNRGLVMSGGPKVYQTGDVGEDLRVKGRDKVVRLIGDKVANELELRGANLVDIRTGSTVHWRLAFILWGTMQGCERSKGMSKSETGLLKPRSG